MNLSRKVTHAAIASFISVTGIVALSAPASAYDVQKCGSTQHLSPDTPGVNVDLWVTPCVQRTGSSSRAVLTFEWLHGNGEVNDYDWLEVIARLERNDAWIETSACNITGPVNNNYSGTYNCITAYHSGTGYTADGKVNYDINNDGKGMRSPWELSGSPTL